jgi:dTDP-4-dehydrorhamnose 3,5-epimerase
MVSTYSIWPLEVDMRVEHTELDSVLRIEPTVFGDARGYFFETWQRERYAAAGMPREFVQDNVSRSKRGILRGLHLQEPFGQGKLIQVLEGEIFDVAVDARVDSPSFGRWVGETLSSDNRRQLYVPAGFAHGFCVVSETALVVYKCTELYHPETELSVAWNDPNLAIPWPIHTPELSKKDAAGVKLSDIPKQRLPRYRP